MDLLSAARSGQGGVPCAGAPGAHGDKPANTSAVMQSLADGARDPRFLEGLHEKLQDYHRAQEKLYGMLAAEQQRVQELVRDNARLQDLLHDKTQMSELVRLNTLLHERLDAALSRRDSRTAVSRVPESGAAAAESSAAAQGQPPPAPTTPPRSKRLSAAPGDDAALQKKQKRPSPTGAELTQEEVAEIVKNVKPLFGLYQWSFAHRNFQKQFWDTLWTDAAYNKTCKTRKADPEGSAWMMMRGLGYGNVGRHDSYHNDDHLSFYWNVFYCIQNAYKNSKVMLGTKARVPDIIKSMREKQRSRPAEGSASGMRLMSQHSEKNLAVLESLLKSFDVDKFLESILPFLPENEARWQPGRRKQLIVFAQTFREFIVRDMIMFSAPGVEL
jgi:hypothetical protein